VAYDRGIKLPLYARHGIQEVWIISLPAKKIEIYRQPRSTGYGEKLEAGPGDMLSPETLPKLTLAAGALLD
jgi:Uma2 family endonuclease